jgi:UDP-glucose 4-epimerase
MRLNVVVTGAAGLIGRAVVDRLLKDGVDVIAVDRQRLEVPGARVIDVTEFGGLAPLLDSETVVFHLAGLTSVPGSVHEPHRDFLINVNGFFAVLEAVREKGAKLIFPSSASVFDPRSPLPHHEGAPKSPNSPYAAAKLACEGYCVAYHKCYGLDVKIARLFNVYGPGMQRFAIYDFYRKIREANEAIEILGDGSQLRDYLFVTDAVEGLLLIAARGQPGADYNVGSGIPIRSYELAQLMLKVMGRTGLRIRTSGQTFPGDVPAWYADISKIRGLGFEPRIELTEGLRRTVEWLQDHERAAVKETKRADRGVPT